LPKHQNPVHLTRVLLIFTLLSLVFLAACQNKGKGELEDFDPNEPIKLKIMYYNQAAFDQQCGNLIQKRYPNLELEVIPYKLGIMTVEDQLDQINTEQPDVLFLSIPLYEKLSAKGRGARPSHRTGSIRYEWDLFCRNRSA